VWQRSAALEASTAIRYEKHSDKPDQVTSLTLLIRALRADSGVYFASSGGYNHQISKQPSGGAMVNVSDGAKEKLLEYLKTNNSDLAVRVILSNG
jgi:hypothetical protein